MDFKGHCYCGDIQYEASGDPILKVQCHCRECQYLSGGSANVTIGMPAAGFKYTKGTPSQFTRSDLDSPVTREFCGNCGTQVLSKAPVLPDVMLIKVGHDGRPDPVQPRHGDLHRATSKTSTTMPDGMPSFERMPG